VEQRFDPRWWGQFGDPVLDSLMSRALAANHDVRIAVARLDQARALFDDVHLDRYPTVTAGAVADRRNEAIPGFTDEPRTISTYRAGFDAFWELDVFGRVRNQVRSAAATAEEYAAVLDDVRVSVAAEVGRSYFELRGLQQRLAVAERNLSSQQETLRLTRVRDDEGFGEPQDVASAARMRRRSKASIPPMRNAIARREHRLAVLTRAARDRSTSISPRARIRCSRRRCRSASRTRCFAAGPTCARRNAGWRPPRRTKRSRPRISIRTSRSAGSSGCWPAAATSSAWPIPAPGR
jgi:multidrug efflux system outer membrane protein